MCFNVSSKWQHGSLRSNYAMNFGADFPYVSPMCLVLSPSLAFYWLITLMCSPVLCFAVILLISTSVSLGSLAYCTVGFLELFLCLRFLDIFLQINGLVYGSSVIGVAYTCIDLCNDDLQIAHNKAHTEFTQLLPASLAHTLHSLSQLNHAIKVNKYIRAPALLHHYPDVEYFISVCVCLDRWDNERCLVLTSTQQLLPLRHFSYSFLAFFLLTSDAHEINVGLGDSLNYAELRYCTFRV